MACSLVKRHKIISTVQLRVIFYKYSFPTRKFWGCVVGVADSARRKEKKERK